MGATDGHSEISKSFFKIRLLMKKRALQAVLVFAIVGLSLLGFNTDESLRLLQKGKYGDPRSICLQGTQIVVDSKWIIDFIYRGTSGSPLLFGLLPVPVKFTKLEGDIPEILLRSLRNRETVSIHFGAPNLPQEKLVANCLASSFCSLEKSRFGGGADVMQVVSGPTTWITYLDRKIMVGVRNAVLDEITGVHISSCPAQGARSANR